jgi:hypothetical protein
MNPMELNISQAILKWWVQILKACFTYMPLALENENVVRFLHVGMSILDLVENC